MIQPHNFFHIRNVVVRLCVLMYFLSPSLSAEAIDKYTPVYYEQTVRQYYKASDWETGKKLLDEGIKLYPEESNLNELMGQYFLNKQDMGKARFFLVRALQNNVANNRARRMLVKVERETKNYSSAICYINELLEGSPYERELWVDKMELYKKQGNKAEVERMLQRLIQLFPEDKEIQRIIYGNMEEFYLHARNRNDRHKAIEQLKRLIAIYPSNKDYYIWIINSLHTEGRYEEALSYAEQGINQTTNNTELARKKIGLLGELHRNVQAKDFLRDYLKRHPGSSLQSLMSDIEKEIAYDALNYDAYIQFGKIYEKSKDPEALQFLLNTSISRGYYDDALLYIREMRKRNGQNDPTLMYKEYTVLKRMGEEQKAVSVLERLFAVQPKNADVLDELNVFHLRQASQAMSLHDYDEAILHLDFVLKHNTGGEAWLSAVKKKYNCLMGKNNYVEASVMLDAMRRTGMSERDYSLMYADLLSHSGRSEEALQFMAALIRRTSETMPEQASYVNLYEEIAVPHIKQLILSGATAKAYEKSKEYLSFCPDSHEGFLYVMSTAKTLGLEEEYKNYAATAFQKYPNDIDILSRWAGMENDEGLYVHTLTALRERLLVTPGDSTLIRLHSNTTDLMAERLVKEKKGAQAIAELDIALKYDGSNKALLYAKGLAYESIHQYDSAHYYLRYYEPSLMELSDFKHRMNTLKNKSLHNDIFMEYIRSRYADNIAIRGMATVGYTHRMNSNSFTATVNYAGRDGGVDKGSADNEEGGGVGLQGLFSWTHNTRRNWSWTLGGGISNRYFARYQANASIDIELPKDWTVDLHVSYRNISTSQQEYRYDSEKKNWVFDHWDSRRRHLFTGGIGVNHQFEMFSVGGKVDALFMSQKWYGYASVQGRYYPLSDRTSYISATAGAGTAPEANILNYGLPGAFSNINSMVGLSATWLFNPNLCFTVGGTWHTFYNQSNLRLGTENESSDNITMKYKNLYNLHVALRFSF